MKIVIYDFNELPDEYKDAIKDKDNISYVAVADKESIGSAYLLLEDSESFAPCCTDSCQIDDNLYLLIGYYA